MSCPTIPEEVVKTTSPCDKMNLSLDSGNPTININTVVLNNRINSVPIRVIDNDNYTSSRVPIGSSIYTAKTVEWMRRFDHLNGMDGVINVFNYMFHEWNEAADNKALARPFPDSAFTVALKIVPGIAKFDKTILKNIKAGKLTTQMLSACLDRDVLPISDIKNIADLFERQEFKEWIYRDFLLHDPSILSYLIECGLISPEVAKQEVLARIEGGWDDDFELVELTMAAL